MKHLRHVDEKKPKGAPDWHDSDAPDANGRFRDLSIKDLAAWLIKTRKKDVKRISGSLTQQIVFNRNDDPKYAEKMEKTRKEVYKQLGREDLLESTLNEGYQYFDGEMARDLKGDSGVKFKKGDKVTLEIQPNNYVIYGPNKTKIIVNKRDFRGAIDQYVIYESLVIEKREDVGKYNTVKKVIKELGRRPSEQELATFINNNYYDVTEVERGDDDPTANDKIADLVGFYKFDIDDWEIAWFDAQNESLVTEASKDRMIKQIERALKDGLSIFKLPMATQTYYRKHKSDFETVEEGNYKMEDIYDLIAHHRFDKDFKKLSSKDKEWVENDAKERGFNESLLESDMLNMYYSLIDELYEAKPGPDAYMTGLSDEEKEEKEAKMKKQADMDDDDPDSYEELPGDEEAREKGKVKKSKHTTAYNKKFKGEGMKNLKSFDNFVTEKRSDLWSPFQKADILAGDMFGAMGLYRLEDDELDQIIDLKKADKLAKKMFGEFGFKTLAAKEMEDLLDNNPKLLRESVVNEAEKYDTEGFKVGDKIKTNFGEWEVIETDYAPKKSFIAPFIFKGKDMKRVNIPNPPKTNKNAVGYKVTDGAKYPIIGFLYQYKDITKLATVGVDESVVTEAATDRFLQSAARNLAKQMRGKSASRTTLMNRLNSMPLANMLKPDELEKIIDYAMQEMGLNESVVNEEKIKYAKGKTYQSSGHYTVMVDSNSSMCDIRVNHSAGWRLDPHDDREETWELLDGGRHRATIYFRRGSIDKFAQQMFDLNDRTTWGNKTKLTAKDYADIIRLWIDMKKANESRNTGIFSDMVQDFEDFVKEKKSLNEANRGKVHRAAKKGSYPAVIVVVQDGKVIHQEPVSTPDVAPATFNVMQEKYPKALLHLEDKTGKRLFSEAKRIFLSKMDESKQSDELAIAINTAIEKIDDSMSYVDFAQAVGKVIRDEYGTHLYKEFKKEINKSLKESVVTEDVDMYYLNNAKEQLSNPHTILDITYDKTRSGDKFVRFDYENKYVPGKMSDTGPHFVKVFYDNNKDLKKISKELNMDLKESVVTEAKEEPIVALLKLGLFASKGTGEKKLLRLSDDFEEIGDEQADEIASHLNMAIELFQDGYSKDAVPHFKKFNKACKDALALMKKQGLAESVITENRMLRKGQFRFGAKLQYGIEDVNESYGFYGTLMDQFGLDEVNELFLDGFAVLGTNYDFTDQAALYYLNSKAGRWVADQVTEKLIGPKNMSPYYGHLEEIFAEYAKKGQWKKWSKEYDQFAEEDNMEEGLMIRESKSDMDEYYRELLEAEQTANDQSPLGDDGMETGIKNKAKESGVPVGLLRIIMRRGLAAWKTGHRPGATQAQWGYARVNSFLTKQPGTWGKADSDIAKKVRDGGHDKDL